MKKSTKATIIIVSIVITIIIFSIGVFLIFIAGDPHPYPDPDPVVTPMIGKYTKFDGRIIKGSSVIALIESLYYSPDEYIGVSVKTNSGSTKWYVYDASNVNNLSKVDRYYRSDNDPNNINPSYVFKGAIVRNDNGEIVAVAFEQQSK